VHRQTPGWLWHSLHPAWIAAWLEHLGGGARPLFLAVRLEEALAGVVPLHPSILEGFREAAAELGVEYGL